MYRYGDRLMKNEKRSILLVEDQAIVAADQALRVGEFGYEVTVVHSGENAISCIHNNAGIDLILMDIDLGVGIDGIEAADRILANVNLPIIFLSSHGESRVIEKARTVSRYGYVYKNADDHVLKTSIEMALELYSAQCRLRECSARIDEIFDHSVDVPYKLDLLDERYEYISPAFGRMLGYDVREFLDMTHGRFMSMMHPDDIGDVKRIHRNATSDVSCGDMQIEYRLMHRDGRYRWLEDSFRVANGKHRERSVLVGCLRDVTDVKSAEITIQAVRDVEIRLSKAKTFEEVARCCLAGALSAQDMCAGGIYLVDGKGDLHLYLHEGLSESFVEKVSFYAKNSPSALLCAQGKPIFVECKFEIGEVAFTMGGGEMKMLARQEGITHLCMLPVVIDGRLTACLNVASKKITEIPRSTRLYVESLAVRLGSEIRRGGISQLVPMMEHLSLER